jgi:phage shock protein E
MRTRRSLLTVLAAAAFLVAPVGLAGCSSTESAAIPVVTAAVEQPASPQRVAVPEWVTAAASPGTVIIDVRTPEEFNAGHVVGAINIPVEYPDFTARVAAELSPEDTFAVYCRTGNRSAAATAEMANMGYVHIFDLNGGFSDLQGTGLPTT